jgi:hypothetical protein
MTCRYCEHAAVLGGCLHLKQKYAPKEVTGLDPEQPTCSRGWGTSEP